MFQIIYQDNDLIAVNKPENLLCVPGLAEDINLFDLVRKRFPNARVVHRLDMATSGIVLFPLNHNAQKNLGHQFEKRQIHKQYSAVLHGRLEPDCGEIVMPLMCDWPNRPKQKVDWLQGKTAITFFQVRSRNCDSTHVQLFPVTGRSHQLRVHCQALGHAILGDQLYDQESSRNRLMLHAEYIQIRHPRTETLLELHSPAPFAAQLRY